MKWLLMVVLLTATPVLAQTEIECASYMLWKEARGESKRTARAVLDVFENRQAAWGLTGCQVLRQKGQYPYMRKRGVKKLDFEAVVRYTVVSEMFPVLTKNYLYFNHVKHPWGKATKRIGKLYFSQ